MARSPWNLFNNATYRYVMRDGIGAATDIVDFEEVHSCERAYGIGPVDVAYQVLGVQAELAISGALPSEY